MSRGLKVVDLSGDFVASDLESQGSEARPKSPRAKLRRERGVGLCLSCEQCVARCCTMFCCQRPALFSTASLPLIGLLRCDAMD